MSRKHEYRISTRWTGNRGSGTLDYRAYSRDHLVSAEGKYGKIEGSSDPLFRGDSRRYNPEELFVSSVSSCHMLWFLHLASVNDVVVLEYEDRAEGRMVEDTDGSGQFDSVTLNPRVKISEADKIELANQLHEEAGRKCFIANSIKLKIKYRPETTAGA